MSSTAPATRRTYLERRVFEHFLRTGTRVDANRLAEASKRKFNPYHDPDDGRFTFKPGGGQLSPRRNADPVRPTGASGPARLPAPRPKAPTVGKAGSAPEAVRQTDSSGKLGSLSSHFETGGRGSETVSSGMGRGGVPDRGGVSYGSYQLTPQTPRMDKNGNVVIVKNGGNVANFLRSDGARWARDFAGLEPGSASFSDAWRKIARRDGAALRVAEHAWVKRNNYDPAVSMTKKETGLDIDRTPIALREVLWSTSVQHGPGNPKLRRGGAAKIFADAITHTDSTTNRNSKIYYQTLIINIYLKRAKYWPSDRPRYRSEMTNAIRRLYER